VWLNDKKGLLLISTLIIFTQRENTLQILKQI
jgi:hypothetical protein